MLPIAIEYLVAGLAGDAELPTHLGHRLAFQEPGDEAKAFFHNRTRSPGHRHLPPKSGKCHPCVRYEMSPMSRVAHRSALKPRTAPAAGGVRAPCLPTISSACSGQGGIRGCV